MKEKVRLAVLLVLFVHHLVSWVRVARLGKPTEEAERKLRVYINMGWRFLTNWNFFNQTIYIIMALFLHVAPKFLKEKTVFKLRKKNWFFFWSIVCPWTYYIPVFFWCIYNYDRELIFPRIIDQLSFPMWLNHCFHTNIIFLVILEPILNPQRPPRFKTAMWSFSYHAAAYVVVLNFTYFYDGLWLYNYLKVMNWPVRIVYYAFTWAYGVFVVWLGLRVQNSCYESRIKAKGT